MRRALLGTLLLLSAAAPAQEAPAGAAAGADAGPAEPGYGGLWTSWTGVNRDSIRAEAEAARSGQAAAADVPRHYQAGSSALGERVGEVVRLGDCQEGERLAREAGDFPLLEAVRAHCRPASPQIRSR